MESLEPVYQRSLCSAGFGQVELLFVVAFFLNESLSVGYFLVVAGRTVKCFEMPYVSPRRYIQPDKPMQNGFIERFNRTFREDVLDMFWFEDIE